MNKVYICHTVYQLYIVLLKEIKNLDKVTVVLSDSIVNHEKIKNDIDNLKLFKKVFLLNEKKLEFNGDKSGIKKFLEYKRIKKQFSKDINIDFRNYDEIYIFNDWSKIGMYIILNNIEYNLIEDGLNTFKIIDKVGYHDYNFIYKTFGNLNLIPLFWGQNKQCHSIEVNDINDIKIPLEKVVEVPRNRIVEELSEKEKSKIFDFFIGEGNLIYNFNEGSIIILTQPLYSDKLVESESEQVQIYKSIVEKYSNKYKNIIIKPHPRDEIQYDFKNCIVVDKKIPIEILNFKKDIKFNMAITIFSTAIDGIDFVDEKITLGFDYINKILKK